MVAGGVLVVCRGPVANFSSTNACKYLSGVVLEGGTY